MSTTVTPVTQLLLRLNNGDAAAEEEAIRSLFAALHDRAIAVLGRDRAVHTLQATALVNEAWLRLRRAPVKWQDRDHYLAVAVREMSRTLIDHARRKNAQKRGDGMQRLDLTAAAEIAAPCSDEVVLVDALEVLARSDPTAARLVQLRFFLGLTMDESAVALTMSRTDAEKKWLAARAWLEVRMGPP